MAWSPLSAGSLLASCGDDGAVYVWNPLQTTGQGTPWQPLGAGNQGQLLSVAWSHPQQNDPLQVAVSDGAGQLYLSNVISSMLDKASPSSSSSGQSKQVWNIAWSPIDNQFAIVCQDGSLQVWTWSDTHHRFRITFHSSVESGEGVNESAAYSVAWSPDGKYIATGNGSGVVQIWSLDNSQKMFRYSYQKGTIWWLAWSPDGNMLASACDDKTVAVVTLQK